MLIGAKEIRSWHVNDNHWEDIGYHFIIRRDYASPIKGILETGRMVNQVGAHVQGFNDQSIGICLVGGCKRDSALLRAENNFTDQQFYILRNLLTVLKYDFPDAIIQGHRDFLNVNKDCPSFDVREWLKHG
jgi:N-acetylmuramoyl-L-alanine amidase